MPDDAVEVPFVVDYELSVDDLREGETIRRRAARRATPLVARYVLPVLSLVLFAATAYADYQLDGCIQDPFQMLTGQCTQTSLNGLVSQNQILTTVDGGFWVLTFIHLGRTWARPSRWYVRNWMKTDGLHGRYHYEVGADGLTGTGSDGDLAYQPWSIFAAVRETDKLFLLFLPGYGRMCVLPKRGLSDQSSVQQLGEFLRISVGRKPPPA